MKTTVKLAALAALFAAVSAHAANNNPLQPNYYWDQAQMAQSAPSAAAGEVKPTNPLDPRFYQYLAKGVDAFQGTASAGSVAITNPLHPQFAHH